MSACGGTHVARTGAIGMIAVAGSERFRGGTRVEFLCGVRALRGYRALRDAVAASVRLLSILPGDLPAGIERMQADAKDTKRQLKDLQARLAAFEADALAEPRGAARRRARRHRGAGRLGRERTEGRSRPPFPAVRATSPYSSACRRRRRSSSRARRTRR